MAAEISTESHLLQLCNAVGGYEVDLETNEETYVLGDEAISKLMLATHSKIV